MNLTKFQINAVRSMARGLAPLQRRLDRIHAKEVAFLESIKDEKEEIQAQIDQINSAIVTYTGGYTVNEVLNPESTVPETAPEGEADETAQVEMTEIVPEVEATGEVAPEVTEETEVEAPVIEEAAAVIPEPTVTAEEEVPFWDRKING